MDAARLADRNSLSARMAASVWPSASAHGEAYMVYLLLIGVLFGLMALLVVALCRAAQRGDADELRGDS